MRGVKFIVILLIAAAFIKSAESSCSAWEWVKCAAVVIGCGGACVITDGIACEDCLGPSWDQCKGCVGFGKSLNEQVTFERFPEVNCSSQDFLNCASGLTDCRAVCEGDISAQKCSACLGGDASGVYKECVRCVHQLAPPDTGLDRLAITSNCSPWDWVKCAAKVAECGYTCYNSGITSSNCRNCLGDSYDQCKSCIGLQMETSFVIGNSSIPDCCESGYIRCTGAFGRCIEPCLDSELTIFSPECFHCLGPALGSCLPCLSGEDQMEMERIGRSRRHYRARKQEF